MDIGYHTEKPVRKWQHTDTLLNSVCNIVSDVGSDTRPCLVTGKPSLSVQPLARVNVVIHVPWGQEDCLARNYNYWELLEIAVDY